jgi:hypothetical protein
MTTQSPNPYASPSEAADRHHSVKFTLEPEQRKLISSTATLMIAAGTVHMLVVLIDLVNDGFAIDSLIEAVVFGVMAAFVAVAGVSLRRAAADGSLEALMSGFRQLHVTFLVKGVMMLLVIGFGLLMVLMFALGVGAGLAEFFFD